jgi:hypothetical protein
MKNIKYNKRILVGILSLIIASLSFVSDNIIFNTISIEIKHYMHWKIIYIMVIMIIGQLIYKLMVNLKDNREVKMSFYFSLICLGILAVFLIMVYPGIWLWDNMEMLSLATEMNMSSWHGYYMQCFFVLSLMLIPFPVGINIVQIVIISAVMGRIFYIISSNIKNKRLSYILIIFLILPANLYWSLMAYRTAFFGFFFSLAILEFINFWRTEDINLFYAIILYGFVWNIRSEGYSLLLFIPIIAYKFIRYKKLKKGLIFIIGTFFFALAVTKPINSDRAYLATAIMNPLGNMMQYDLNSDHLESDLSKIDKVFSVDIMKNSVASPLSTSVEGSAWSKEGIWDNIYCSDYDWKNMLEAYANLVYFNPLLFIKLRAKTMLSSITLNKNNVGTIASLINGSESKFGFSSYIGSKPISEDVRQIIRKIIGFEYGGNAICNLGIVLGSAIIPMLMVFLLLVYSIIKKCPEMLCVSLVTLTTIFIVYISAPAANPMYYYSIYNSMFLILFVFIVKLIDKLLQYN